MRSPTSEYAGKMRHHLSQAGIGTEITTRSSNELQYKQRTAASMAVRSKRPQRFFKVLPGKRRLTIETNMRQNSYKIRENTDPLLDVQLAAALLAGNTQTASLPH